MSKYEANARVPEKTEHRDYSYNLDKARNFISKLEGRLPPGMSLRIADSHGLPQALLWISWTPPRHTPVGNWANPIFFHQAHGTFGQELERIFNDYVRRVEDFEKKFGDKQEIC
jgi:hypothetical protein